MMTLVVNFPIFIKKKNIFCFVVAIFDLVYDLETKLTIP